eukprot:COSAG01_NODE_1125_length_11596_cov_8.205532_6_plen_37_part_00
MTEDQCIVDLDADAEADGDNGEAQLNGETITAYSDC